MKKIEIEIKPIQNKIVKFGGNKIEIKPYIESEDLVLLTQLCLQKIIIDKDNFGNLAILHTIFDMCVIELCTSIHIDGIKISNEDKKTIDLDLDISKFENFDILGLSEFASKNIKNYDRSWQTIFEIMQLATINNALGLIRDSVPTQESMSKTIEEFGNAVKEINEKDPENLKNIIRVASENNAFTQVKSEFSEKQKTEKVKKLDEAIKKTTGKIKSKK